MLIICFIYHQYNRYTTIDQLELNYLQTNRQTKLQYPRSPLRVVRVITILLMKLWISYLSTLCTV